MRSSPGFLFDSTNFTVLAVNAEPSKHSLFLLCVGMTGTLTVSRADAGRAVLVLDSTWRYVKPLLSHLTGTPVYRSIPAELKLKTATKRRSKLFVDPPEALTSVEAVFVTKLVLGEPDCSLLDGYQYKDEFLQQFRSPTMAGLIEKLTGLAWLPPPLSAESKQSTLQTDSWLVSTSTTDTTSSTSAAAETETLESKTTSSRTSSCPHSTTQPQLEEDLSLLLLTDRGES